MYAIPKSFGINPLLIFFAGSLSFCCGVDVGTKDDLWPPNDWRFNWCCWWWRYCIDCKWWCAFCRCCEIASAFSTGFVSIDAPNLRKSNSCMIFFIYYAQWWFCEWGNKRKQNKNIKKTEKKKNCVKVKVFYVGIIAGNIDKWKRICRHKIQRRKDGMKEQ